MKLTLFHKIGISIATAGVALAVVNASSKHTDEQPPPAPASTAFVKAP